MNEFMKELKEYDRVASITAVFAAKVVKHLVEAIKPTIPGIKGFIGGMESGIDTIIFTVYGTDSHSQSGNDKVSLDSVIEQIFPVFDYASPIIVDCWGGVYVDPDELKELTKSLTALRDNEDIQKIDHGEYKQPAYSAKEEYIKRKREIQKLKKKAQEEYDKIVDPAYIIYSNIEQSAGEKYRATLKEIEEIENIGYIKDEDDIK